MATSSNGYDGGSSGRVNLKDVYDIVGKLDTKLDDLKETVQTVTVSHEHRLTSIETTQAAGLITLAAAGKELQDLRDEHNIAKGHVHALAWVAGALGTSFCGFGAFGLAHLLHW